MKTAKIIFSVIKNSSQMHLENMYIKYKMDSANKNIKCMEN